MNHNSYTALMCLHLHLSVGHHETPGIICFLVIAPVFLSDDFTIVANLGLHGNGCKGLWVMTEIKVRLRSDMYLRLCGPVEARCPHQMCSATGGALAETH